jgi:flagellar motility protein MotE (MotC chaperone)
MLLLLQLHRHALAEIDRKIAHIKEVLEREKEQDRKTKELIEVEEGLREAERLWEQGKQELSRMEGTLQAEERALARADQASKHDESFTVSYKEVVMRSATAKGQSICCSKVFIHMMVLVLTSTANRA